MKIYILDNDNDVMNPIVRLLYRDLMGGFERLGFDINYKSCCKDVKENSLVFFDNNVKKDSIDYLSNNLINIICFAWCCHENRLKNLDLDRLKLFYITCHTKTPIGKEQRLLQDSINYVPLYHRANEDIKMIGKYERVLKYDWCYIGAPYRRDLIPKNKKYTNYLLSTFNPKRYISSNERKNIYLSSIVHLAYQGERNIKDGHVSQRVFEGLCYGCIVLSNSIVACIETNNIVEYVRTLDDVEKKIEYYKNNPDKVIEKQILGYEFSRIQGTNMYSIEKLNEKSDNVYNINFLRTNNLKLCDDSLNKIEEK